MAVEGLLDADPAGEAVRNVIASPLAGIDPAALIDIRAIVAALEVRLATDPALHRLSAKFCFLVDDGGRLPLRDVRADIRFETVRVEGEPAFVVGFDGAVGRFGPVVADDLVDTAATLAKAFIATGARRVRDVSNISRLAASASLNASPVEGEVGKASALTGGGYGAAGRLLGLWPLHPPPAATDVASASPSRGEAKIICGVGLPFGRIDAADLASLAASAAESGATEIRLTPWRAILIPGPASTADSAMAAAHDLGLILDLADPRRRVAACVGAPACASASTDVRIAAEQFAPLVGEGSFLHVSGCAKGCAHPRPAPVTLVGRDGLYDLVRNGGPSDTPVAMALTLDAAAQHLRDMAIDTPRSGRV
jgi:precorrin-3B synthase